MKTPFKTLITLTIIIAAGCSDLQQKKEEFKYTTEQFADLRIIRYQVPGFETLELNQKELLYYLYQAALSGRDITYDQNYKHNLCIRRTFEEIVDHYTGDRMTDDFEEFMVYTKRVWFSNGIHHHYSADKLKPGFSTAYFTELIKDSPEGNFPVQDGETEAQLIEKLTPILFDPTVDAKGVNQDPKADMIVESANNYYENVTQKEVEKFYRKTIDKKDPRPISYGLNSKMIKTNGNIFEKTWKIGGMYTEAIEKIVYWLKKASGVAENATQKAALDKLVEYYKSGDLSAFDEYNILWVQDTESDIDVINGFIEVYGDALGYRAAYESVVQVNDPIATRRITAIGDEAQWFEDNSPIMPEHKKIDVKGISARVINVVVESGATSPNSPIGINLPNANWIRAEHGSKSVTLGNIMDAYNGAAKESGGLLEEFTYSQEEIDLAKEHGTLSNNLSTDMHEVIGHASGRLNPGVATPKETLKNYASTLEEARADLVGLYFIMDQKLIDIGVMPTLDVGKAEFNRNIRNGLMTQLRRINLGDDIEEAHMRNRQLNAKWVYEKGRADNVIEKKVRDGKTYFVINDYQKLRVLFGELLREIQRIKSEGDYEAAKTLVETYGVKVDQDLHKEVLKRFEKLNIAPYGGFINPRLVPVIEGDKIVDVKIEYPEDFTEQMLYYAKEYSYLPTYN